MMPKPAGDLREEEGLSTFWHGNRQGVAVEEQTDSTAVPHMLYIMSGWPSNSTPSTAENPQVSSRSIV